MRKSPLPGVPPPPPPGAIRRAHAERRRRANATDLSFRPRLRTYYQSRHLKLDMESPAFEENLAPIQTIFGEKSRAISTLTHLLQIRYGSWLYEGPITPSLLRLDPIWDSLRSDPAFQKLCDEKQL